MAQVNFISASKLVALLNEADRGGKMNVRVLTTNKLALGVDPLNPDSVIDLSKEVIRSIVKEHSLKPADSLKPLSNMPNHAQVIRTPKNSRASGKYFIEVLDCRAECVSLKDILSNGLNLMEKSRPGTLEKLSKFTPRSKHIVSRDKYNLFQDAALVEKYSEKLNSEWWYGTNNSAPETKSWLERCAKISGLEWGKEVKLSF